MSPAPLAVVIPALNEARRLPLLLADLAQAPPGLIRERLVVDGGSADGSRNVARWAGAELLRCDRGRGRQLQCGIAATTAPWLLLLHADCRLPGNWAAAVQGAMVQPEAAWCFDLAIEGGGAALRLVELAVRLRSQLRQLPYGDQGLLLPRGLLERCGGVQPLPLMEDLDLVLRLRALSRIRRLRQALQVDRRRWDRLGVLTSSWRNAQLRRAWRSGCDPAELERLYYGANR